MQKSLFVVGQKDSITRTFSKQDVKEFAKLVGDYNPLHLEDEFAQDTNFKACIVHGTFYTGLLGAVMGTKLPGPGTVLVYQQHNFFKPVYLNQEITAEVEVIEVHKDKPVLVLELRCVNSKGEELLRGEATVMVHLVGSR